MKKLHNIEFLRVLMTAVIIYYHLLHDNIMPFVAENSLYTKLASMNGWGSTAVEGFLIIAGYFLYFSYVRKPNKPYIEFVVERFVRLWPVFAVYTILSIFVYKLDIQNAILDLCLLRGTGISLNSFGIIWYIGPFFWCSLLVYGILKCFNNKTSALLFALITYFGYAINLNLSNGGLTRKILLGFISGGMLRVLCGLCVGCLLAMAIEAFCNTYENKENGITTILFTLIELVCIPFFFVVYVYRKGVFNNAFVVVIFTVLLVTCLVNRKGILSRIVDLPIFSCLGKYCYSIYVMQSISFTILSKTLWKYSDFINENVILTLVLSIITSFIVGVLSYYLIEQPTVYLYKKYKKKSL